MYDYDDEGKYDNIYDKMIYNWAINEIPMYLGEQERIEIKELYGNRKTGVLFRGMSINSQEELEQIEQILEEGSSEFDFGNRFVSSTPHEYEAKTFMHYTKSYDPYTMAAGMRKLSETGCKGNFATVLLEFEIPNKEQVIFKNYHDKGEENLLLPTHTAETEVLLYGKVNVKKITIQYPLNMENYKENILNNINKISDFNNPPYKMWIQKNLSEEESQDLFNLSLEKLEKIYKSKSKFIKDIIELIYDENKPTMFKITKDIFNKYEEIGDFISKKIRLLNGFPVLGVKINRKNLSIEKEIDGVNMANEYKDVVFDDIVTLIKNFKDDKTIKISELKRNLNSDITGVIPSINKFDLLYGKNMKKENDNFYIFNKLIKLSEDTPELLEVLINTDYYKNNNKILKEYLNEYILIEDKSFDPKVVDDYWDMLETTHELKSFLITEQEIVQKMFMHFYQYIPTGTMDKDMKDFLSSYTSKVLPKAMGTTTDIIKFVDNFKNTLLEIKLNNELENISKKESIPGLNK